jgi:hypothetical protein
VPLMVDAAVLCCAVPHRGKHRLVGMMESPSSPPTFFSELTDTAGLHLGVDGGLAWSRAIGLAPLETSCYMDFSCPRSSVALRSFTRDIELLASFCRGTYE